MSIFSSHPTSRHAEPRKGSSRAAIVVLAALAPVMALLVVVPTTSSATQPAGHKVTICHRTNSDTNPYVQNSVDIASSGYLQAGHNGKNGHTGPVWNPTLKGDHVKWGDIIPPYDYTPSATKKDPHPATFHFAGYNWTTEGHAIYDAGCQPPVTATAPSATAPTCLADGALVVPADTKWVSYTSTPKGTGPGTYTVTAKAAKNFVLVGTSQWTIKVLPKLTGDACTTTTVTHLTPAAVATDATCTSNGMGTISVSPLVGATWTIDGTAVTTADTQKLAADHTYVVVATAATGYDFGVGVTTKTFNLVIDPATGCGTTLLVATPVNPTVVQSTTCEVQGTYTIPATTGLTYMLGTKAVAAGTYDGPASGTVTAVAATGYTLSNATWSYALSVPAAEVCVDAPTTNPTPTETKGLPKTGAPVPLLATTGALALLLGFALLAAGTRRPETLS